jgi:hypothetical protein
MERPPTQDSPAAQGAGIAVRNNILKALMASVCAYELIALVAETFRWQRPQSISVLTSRSKVMRALMAVGYLLLGVHVSYIVRGDPQLHNP